MFSGRMMMIRACLSLLIPTVVKDLVSPQVSGTPFDCVFVSSSSADFSDTNRKNHFV
jgi:hypothetical protein